MNAKLGQVPCRVQHIIDVSSREPDTLAHHGQLLVQRQIAGKLFVPLIDKEGESADRAAIRQPNRAHDVPVHGCDLFAFLQIGPHVLPSALRHFEHHAAA